MGDPAVKHAQPVQPQYRAALDSQPIERAGAEVCLKDHAGRLHKQSLLDRVGNLVEQDAVSLD